MKKGNKTVKKGFTLIELLVVIAILAVLAVVVVLTLNPAGLLQESRDSNRISDMATLKSALSLYLADVTTPSLAPSSTICYVSIPSSTGWSVTWNSNTNTAVSNCSSWFPSVPSTTTSIYVATTSVNARAVNGTVGWIPVNLSLVSAGAPFAQWPIDPVNNVNDFYSYTASTSANVFKVAMFMESAKYRNGGGGGSSDVVSTDGGQNNYVFEGGSSLSL